MVYQNYNDIPVLNNAQVYGGTAGLSEAQINKMRAKEEKRRRKEAQKAAKAAEQAATRPRPSSRRGSRRPETFWTGPTTRTSGYL